MVYRWRSHPVPIWLRHWPLVLGGTHMSKIALTPNGSGTGTFTIAAPNSNTNRTLTLPDSTGELYGQGNILGTVTQSSGIPTGAIIERGSNANGQFVRYADGTMICTMTRTENRSSSGLRSTTVTYPSTFAAALSTDGTVDATLVTTRPDIATTISVDDPATTTATSCVITINRSTSTSTTFFITATGRWF